MLFLETIRNPAEAEGKHLHAASFEEYEYAHVNVRVQPLPRGSGVKIDPIETEEFPARFFQNVEQGILQVIATGIMARCEMTDVKVEVTGGSYHDKDSTPEAFEKAAIIATRKAMMAAEPYLLEVVSALAVEVPEEFVGAIIGEINNKRGRIEKLELHAVRAGFGIITASVPHMELADLVEDLALSTQRRATCTHAPAGYDVLPVGVARTLIHRCPHCRERVIPNYPERICPNCGRRADSSDDPMVAE